MSEKKEKNNKKHLKNMFYEQLNETAKKLVDESILKKYVSFGCFL